jgi:hypothetical protein
MRRGRPGRARRGGGLLGLLVSVAPLLPLGGAGLLLSIVPAVFGGASAARYGWLLSRRIIARSTWAASAEEAA